MSKARDLWDQLFQLGPQRQQKPRASLYEVIVDSGDLDRAKRFIEGGHALSQRMAGGHSLSLAAKHGDLEFVRFFIENAPDLENDVKPPDGAYDLLSSVIERISSSDDAALEESMAIFDYLLQQDALQGQIRQAYLDSAVRHQVTPALLLLDAGLEDDEIRTGAKSTSSTSAFLEERDCPEFAALLRSESVDIDALKKKEAADRKENAELAAVMGGITTSRWDERVLTGDALRKRLDSLVEEIRAGKWNQAMTSQDEVDSRTPLEFACQNGLTEVVNAILEIGEPSADAAARAAILAATLGHLDALRALQAGGVPVEQTPKVQNSPLSEACRYGHRDVVLYLLELGADSNSGDGSGHGFTLDELAGGEHRGEIIAALEEHRR